MSDEEERVPWEQIPDETPRAYAAFSVYRDMGAGRTLDGAYRQFRQQQARNRQETGTTNFARLTAPGAWTGWYTDNVWKERATKYDRHIERLARSQREEAHARDLEAHRERCRSLSIASSSAAIKLSAIGLKRVQAVLEAIDPVQYPDPDPAAEGLTDQQRLAAQKVIDDRNSIRSQFNTMKMGDIAHMLRLAANLGQVATNAEAQALAVVELLEALNAERSGS